MKKLWRRVCTIALAAVLTVSAVPMLAMAEEQAGWTDERGTFDMATSYESWTQNTIHSPKGTNERVQDPEDENNYVLKTGAKDYVYTWAPKFEVGKQYKITLRYKGEEGSTPYVALRAGGGFTSPGFRGKLSADVSAANRWENYTAYFTIPKAFTAGPYLHLGDVNCATVGYYDDVLITTDTENSISYVCTADFSDEIGNTQWPDYKTSSYRGTPVEKISAVTAGDTGHGITAVGHYIPGGTADEKFNLISCVYQLDKETKEKQLTEVQITPGTATGGHAATVSAAVTVPEETDEYTYEVKSFLWSELAALQSLAEASTLAY